MFRLCYMEATSTAVTEVFLKVKYIFFLIKRCQVYNHQQSLFSQPVIFSVSCINTTSQRPQISSVTLEHFCSLPPPQSTLNYLRYLQQWDAAVQPPHTCALKEIKIFKVLHLISKAKWNQEHNHQFWINLSKISTFLIKTMRNCGREILGESKILICHFVWFTSLY